MVCILVIFLDNTDKILKYIEEASDFTFIQDLWDQ